MKYVSLVSLLMFDIVFIYESVHDFSFVTILSFLINNPCRYLFVVISLSLYILSLF